MSHERMKMACKIERREPFPGLECAKFDENRIEEIAKAMLDAYEGTVDYEGEDLKGCIKELHGLIDGKYGDFVKEASYFIEKDGEIASAVFISLWKEKPLVTYVFTMKKHSGHHMARALLLKSIDSLRRMGYEELFLFVTVANENAVKLYRDIGFVPIVGTF